MRLFRTVYVLVISMVLGKVCQGLIEAGGDPFWTTLLWIAGFMLLVVSTQPARSG